MEDRQRQGDDLLYLTYLPLQGEDFDPEELTQSGIDLWYLDLPVWASGKKDYRKKFLKPRRKTRICLDWERARETEEPPPNAPVWWGCPRGERCEVGYKNS